MRKAVRFLLSAVACVCVQFANAQTVSTTFNTPGFGGEKTTTLEDALISLIDNAKAGASIHIGIYNFDRLPVAIALLKANARGVNVRIVFDGEEKKQKKQTDSSIYALLNGYEPLNLPKLSCTTNECIKFCSFAVLGGSCRGVQNNHNKFMLVSELTDGQKNIVALTSSNISAGQLNNYNDLVLMIGDAKLYENTLAYWHALRKDKFKIPGTSQQVVVKVPLVLEGNLAQIYTFPNFKFDPILELLKRVSCQLPDSKIRVLQSRLTDHRVKIAKRLSELASQGCNVAVIGRREPEHNSPGKKIQAALGNLLSILKYEEPDGAHYSSIHSKVVLIDASIDNSAEKRAIVLAGSHNMNGNSLKWNDELLAQIENRRTFTSYLNYWNHVFQEAEASDMFINR